MLAVTAGSRRQLYHHDDSGAHSSAPGDISSDVPEPYTYVDGKRNMCCMHGKSS